MDNTWATPLYFKALEHGVDVIVHASTKYPAGHSDVLLGTVSANAACWPQLWATFDTLGICAGPDDVYQVLRGLRTMGVRLERHQQSALEIARWLETKPGVARVLHPALESHPGHAIWKRDFSGSSGIFSVVLDGAGEQQSHAFLDALKIFGLGYSWGGYESLAVPGQRRRPRWSRKGLMAAPSSACRSGSKTCPTSRPISSAGWRPRQEFCDQGQADRCTVSTIAKLSGQNAPLATNPPLVHPPARSVVQRRSHGPSPRIAKSRERSPRL